MADNGETSQRGQGDRGGGPRKENGKSTQVYSDSNAASAFTPADKAHEYTTTQAQGASALAPPEGEKRRAKVEPVVPNAYEEMIWEIQETPADTADRLSKKCATRNPKVETTKATDEAPITMMVAPPSMPVGPKLQEGFPDSESKDEVSVVKPGREKGADVIKLGRRKPTWKEIYPPVAVGRNFPQGYVSSGSEDEIPVVKPDRKNSNAASRFNASADTPASEGVLLSSEVKSAAKEQQHEPMQHHLPDVQPREVAPHMPEIADKTTLKFFPRIAQADQPQRDADYLPASNVEPNFPVTPQSAFHFSEPSQQLHDNPVLRPPIYKKKTPPQSANTPTASFKMEPSVPTKKDAPASESAKQPEVVPSIPIAPTIQSTSFAPSLPSTSFATSLPSTSFAPVLSAGSSLPAPKPARPRIILNIRSRRSGASAVPTVASSSTSAVATVASSSGTRQGDRARASQNVAPAPATNRQPALMGLPQIARHIVAERGHPPLNPPQSTIYQYDVELYLYYACRMFQAQHRNDAVQSDANYQEMVTILNKWQKAIEYSLVPIAHSIQNGRDIGHMLATTAISLHLPFILPDLIQFLLTCQQTAMNYIENMSAQDVADFVAERASSWFYLQQTEKHFFRSAKDEVSKVLDGELARLSGQPEAPGGGSANVTPAGRGVDAGGPGRGRGARVRGRVVPGAGRGRGMFFAPSGGPGGF